MHMIEVQETQLLSGHIRRREHHSLALRARPAPRDTKAQLPV